MPAPDRLAHVKVDANRISEEFARPDVVALVAQGYRLAAVIPAEDRGEPMFVLVFEPPSKVQAGVSVADLRSDLGAYAWMALFVLVPLVVVGIVLLAAVAWRVG